MRIYAQYKEKGFAIVGVSSDKKKASWEKAISDDNTPWKHFIENENNSITKTFKLNTIPAYILVDNKARILAFDCADSKVKNFGGKLRADELSKTISKYLK